MSVLAVEPLRASERMKSLSETPMYVKMLVYGDSGVGKTWLSCTAPEPLLILSDWAVARPTLERLRRDKGIDPMTIFVNSWDDFMDAYAYAASNVGKYKTVVVDSLTDLNTRAMREVLATATTRRNTHDPDQLEQSDWGKVANRTLYAVELFRDLPCDVVMTALAQEIKNEMFTAPLVAPKSAQKRLPAYFNAVGYLVAEQRPGKPSIRKLHMDLSLTFQAKNPGGALPPMIEEPDLSALFPQIVQLLKGGDKFSEKTAKTVPA